MFWNTSYLRSSFKVRDQILHLYKTPRKLFFYFHSYIFREQGDDTLNIIVIKIIVMFHVKLWRVILTDALEPWRRIISNDRPSETLEWSAIVVDE
jgi:hypothetical protein